MCSPIPFYFYMEPLSNGRVLGSSQSAPRWGPIRQHLAIFRAAWVGQQIVIPAQSQITLGTLEPSLGHHLVTLKVRINPWGAMSIRAEKCCFRLFRTRLGNPWMPSIRHSVWI